MDIKNDIVKFKIFSGIEDLMHGFSSRAFGSMRPDHPGSESSLTLFSDSLGISTHKVITMHQVHSNNIQWVKSYQVGQSMPETDGIFTNEKSLFLSVLSADCIPVLFYDRRKKYVGAVHAGWKGIYNEILAVAINQLETKGADPKDLLIAIGPCIRSCCYNINRERAVLFRNKFPAYTAGVESRNSTTYLNLPEIAKWQLYSEGIPFENIEDCNICTSDNTDRFFSFRKEGKNFGEFIGIIGMSE
jgi:YfiH family protein